MRKGKKIDKKNEGNLVSIYSYINIILVLTTSFQTHITIILKSKLAYSVSDAPDHILHDTCLVVLCEREQREDASHLPVKHFAFGLACLQLGTKLTVQSGDNFYY